MDLEMRTQICQKCNFQFTEADKFWDEFQRNGKCPNCDPPERHQRTSGNRFIVAVLSWLFSSVGIWFSLIFFFSGLTSGKQDGLIMLISYLPLLGWISLGVMTAGWLKNQQCHSLWPIVGSLSGIFSAIVCYQFYAVYISAVPLAIYLVFWHSLRKTE
jgi:hypothetical protein